MTQLFYNFINGEYNQTNNSEKFVSVNPYKPDVNLGEFINSDNSDVTQALQSSHEAFKKWSKVNAPRRVEILQEAILQVENNKETLAKIMTEEQGKPLRESIGEITKSIAESRFMIGEGLRLYGQTAPSEKNNSWVQTKRVPIGPVIAITPWNFPVLTPLRKIIPALITGNTIVIKPSELSPLTGLTLVKLLHQSDLPKGVLNLVNGKKETGECLVRNNLTKAITFTGSTTVGKEINKSASDKMVRVQAELGGKNPAIIWDYKKPEEAVQEIIGAAFACTGQRCTAISRIIVQESKLKYIEGLLEEQINKIKLGNGLDNSTTMGPLISEYQRNKVENMVGRAKEEGARVVIGGKKISDKEGYFYSPTLISDVKEEMEIAKEEVFGPVLTIHAVKTFEQAINVANDTKYGLTSAIFSDQIEMIGKFVDNVQSGMVHVNQGTAPESHMPFGGVNESGIGQGSVGVTTKDFFTDIKTIYIKHS